MSKRFEPRWEVVPRLKVPGDARAKGRRIKTEGLDNRTFWTKFFADRNCADMNALGSPIIRYFVEERWGNTVEES